ncbi:metallophosphoesterase family protein [Kineococcus glutinatus]|uniref:Metallophosphoesterase n=1 Tax=Kineococcus glutinatus TaxID=1070872 RepID=A0ABP9HQY1_9ACTN
MTDEQPPTAGDRGGAHRAPREESGPTLRRLHRRVLRWAALLAVALAGAWVGAALAPGTTTFVGPLQTEVRVSPSASPGVRVDLPPVGQVAFDTHRVPVAVTARITSVDLDAASRLVRSPQQLLALEVTAGDTVRAATVRAAAYGALCTLAGAAGAVLLVFRGVRRPLQVTAAGTALLLAGGGVTVLTFDAGALQQPRFTGLLSQAPYIVTNTRNALDRLESYRTGLSQFVRQVTTLYAVSADLPVQGGAADPTGLGEDVTTVLHISDIHLNPLGFDLAASLVGQFDVQAVVDTGDVTTWGSTLESTTLSRTGTLGAPYVFVRGNHDSVATAEEVARQPGALVLDGGRTEVVAGIRFAGIGDPRFTPAAEGQTAEGSALEQERGATKVLAQAITTWNAEHPEDPVDVALMHNPSAPEPLHGVVPLVLTGHMHSRSVALDEASGTRLMVQGSTGGGGISELERFSEGEPLPLEATLLHFAASGDRQGQLVAYDEVTVGGLGLASVQLERTVVDPDEVPPLRVPSTSPSTGGSADDPGSTASAGSASAAGG